MGGSTQMGQHVIAMSSTGGNIEMGRSKNMKQFGKSLINPKHTQKESGAMGNIESMCHNMSMDDG
jgi:hypothetical protein